MKQTKQFISTKVEMGCEISFYMKAKIKKPFIANNNVRPFIKSTYKSLNTQNFYLYNTSIKYSIFIK